MSDADHRDLVTEARADRAVLHELRERIQGLHGSISDARKAEFDGLRREFAALQEDFETLHDRDMARDLDRGAHRAWRVRARSLTARVVEFAGTSTSR
jgi:hypothetical protein